MRGCAAVRLCIGKYVGGFLNDYVPGFNHHPSDDPNYSLCPPHDVRPPERGKMYEMIKMKWNERRNCYDYDQIAYIVYAGPQFSEDDLMSMERINKAQGYYPRHRFKPQSENEFYDGIVDSRTTLLWLPKAQTDDNGEFKIEFFTSDVTSMFDITVIGMTETGDVKQVSNHIKVR